MTDNGYINYFDVLELDADCKAGEVRFVCALREMGKDDVPSRAVEIVRQPFGEVLIRKVAGF